MTAWFDEKASQVNTGNLLAFGVPLTSRYAKAGELSEMLLFAQKAAIAGVAGAIKEVFYDSKACICTITLHRESDWLELEDTLKECGEATIRQFDLNGTVYHGADLLGSDD